jgi:hypothetical protein
LRSPADTDGIANPPSTAIRPGRYARAAVLLLQ